MSLARFTEIWTSGDYPPEPVAEADLRGVEQRLDVRLPEDYRQAVLRVGLPRPTIALVDAIVERELDLHSLGDFYSPAEIIEETIAWREIGMPEGLVAFASDGSGNKFCFDADRLNKGSAEAAAIWFYDHDFGTSDRIAASFADWIEEFCRVEPWPATDAT
jgi:cell wall assembly regulator SMI1